MKKIFISQPMRDKTPECIEKERQHLIEVAKKIAKKELKEDEVEILQSYNPEWKDLNPIDCLGKSLQILAQADIVIFAKDWEKARGCKIEHDVAVEYGVKYGKTVIESYSDF